MVNKNKAGGAPRPPLVDDRAPGRAGPEPQAAGLWALGGFNLLTSLLLLGCVALPLWDKIGPSEKLPNGSSRLLVLLPVSALAVFPGLVAIPQLCFSRLPFGRATLLIVQLLQAVRAVCYSLLCAACLLGLGKLGPDFTGIGTLILLAGIVLFFALAIASWAGSRYLFGTVPSVVFQWQVAQQKRERAEARAAPEHRSRRGTGASFR